MTLLTWVLDSVFLIVEVLWSAWRPQLSTLAAQLRFRLMATMWTFRASSTFTSISMIWRVLQTVAPGVSWSKKRGLCKIWQPWLGLHIPWKFTQTGRVSASELESHLTWTKLILLKMIQLMARMLWMKTAPWFLHIIPRLCHCQRGVRAMTWQASWTGSQCMMSSNDDV